MGRKAAFLRALTSSHQAHKMGKEKGVKVNKKVGRKTCEGLKTREQSTQIFFGCHCTNADGKHHAFKIKRPNCQGHGCLAI